MRYSSRQVQKSLYFATPPAFSASDGGMAKVHSGEEILNRVHENYRRQTVCVSKDRNVSHVRIKTLFSNGCYLKTKTYIGKKLLCAFHERCYGQRFSFFRWKLIPVLLVVFGVAAWSTHFGGFARNLATKRSAANFLKRTTRA